MGTTGNTEQQCSAVTRRKEMAPQVGLEPTTLRLTAGCSAIELLRSVELPTHRGRRIF
jgi:hypothetical protein